MAPPPGRSEKRAGHGRAAERTNKEERSGRSQREETEESSLQPGGTERLDSVDTARRRGQLQVITG